MNEILIKNQPVLNKILNKIRKTDNNVQAYILTGDSKEILRDYAILFSKVLICPNKYEENCESCNICMRIDNNSFGELKIINPENGIIKKDSILELRNSFNTNSIEGKQGVYIINDIELLNVSSANAILKFLEEPEGNFVAIFTTTNIDGVIKTISSRCQVIKVNNYKTKYGMEFVKEISTLDEEKIYKVIDFTKLIEKNKTKAFAQVKNEFLALFDTKEAIATALNVMLLYYKDMLNYKIKGKCLYFEKNDVNMVANMLEEDDVLRKISFILENIGKLEYNVNMLLFMDNLIIGIGEIQDDKSSRN